MESDRTRRERREQALNFRLNEAATSKPFNSEVRVVKKLSDEESSFSAIDRAKLMPWWNFVIDEKPKFDARFWVWFIRP